MKVFGDFDPGVLNGLTFDISNPLGRINHGTVLLSWFCKPPGKAHRSLELGSGSGAISIYLASRYGIEASGIEVDEQLYKLSLENARRNGVEDRVSFFNCSVVDFLASKHEKHHDFDIVVSNPPHYLHPGIESPDSRRNTARRMSHQLMGEFVGATGELLKNRGAFFFLIHPRDLTKWIRRMEDVRLAIHRIRFVHGKSGGQAQLVLIAGRKNSSSEVLVEPPIILR
ncbi:MAG: methyltransferase [Mesotoga sp.]|jgi:tRNA1(Val) A37 N6-methylase TrmN6|uniref:Methyltransferase small n=2 Tax=Mesotoga infera TaxID=1236046 RepID=A0A7Z7PQ10_9BACT|nr:methyltransferase [Mesotoga sp.]NLI07198.1 methyltransferase [Thermotogaceae bacterium]SSC13974.1 Methyltransferase small [Mesotoga infera]HOI33756.1 methyltransferase [Mesotoga infera]HON27824.1 methyltransferase [Mesotoga infera]